MLVLMMCEVARIISSLLAAGILQMRGVRGQTGWFWLFVIEGLMTFTIGLTVCFWIWLDGCADRNRASSTSPPPPPNTKSVLYPRPWYTERQEVIMINVGFTFTIASVSGAI